jgi:hypothetical protein
MHITSKDHKAKKAFTGSRDEEAQLTARDQSELKGNDLMAVDN